mmetsp:Transcript_15791/g.40242  ORF Transcript_15791/g.40242 Transcript_15791/m.40242 type:complete len:225 (-) Transcript_15791:525-1199(-)
MTPSGVLLNPSGLSLLNLAFSDSVLSAMSSPTSALTPAFLSASSGSALLAALASFTSAPLAWHASERAANSASGRSGWCTRSSAAQGSVVTWKHSPAPSASDVEMMGVCRYRKPCFWKNRWVAMARAFLIRATEAIVFVRARRWSWERRNSKLVFFLAMGYLAPSQGPWYTMSSAWSSIFCLVPGGVFFTLPLTTIEDPVLVRTPRLSMPDLLLASSETITWRF